jgi:hypothetical protein
MAGKSNSITSTRSIHDFVFPDVLFLIHDIDYFTVRVLI